MDLKISCGCIPGYQARKGLHTGTVKKLTQINFVILNSYVEVIYLRFIKNIYRQLKTKFGNSCIGFFPKRKLIIYKMTSVRKSYTFQNLLKNITLLPAEKFRNINLYQQTVLLKIIYDFRIEISFMEK